MVNVLKNRLSKLRNKYDLDTYSAIVFVEFHNGKFQVKKQEHTPKFIETHIVAEFDNEREACDYLETMDGDNIIFWDIFPEDVEGWKKKSPIEAP